MRLEDVEQARIDTMDALESLRKSLEAAFTYLEDVAEDNVSSFRRRVERHEIEGMMEDLRAEVGWLRGKL